MTLEYNTNLTAGTTITIPLRGIANVTIDWGDASDDTYTTTGNKEHIYASEGIYTVTISGSLTAFGFESTYTPPNTDNLVKVTDFGTIGLISLDGAFHNSTNLEEVPVTLPSTITSLEHTFWGTGKTTITNLDGWDVSNVTNMLGTFMSAASFNQDISSWNVSNVTNMNNMFSSASVFNQDISGWNVGNVTDMGSLFNFAQAFNQDLGGWNVSKVTDIGGMFRCTPFNYDIGSWDVSKVTNMGSIFYQNTSFNQDISGWNVSKVEYFNEVFNGADSFNQDIGNWVVSSAISMSAMFNSCDNFDQDLSSWNVSNVQWGANMFNGITLSPENYDALLISWAALDLYDGVTFSGGNSKYSPGAAATAKQSIIDDDSWTITDGGIDITYYMAKVSGNWSSTSIWYTNSTGGTTPGDYTTAATEAPTAANSDGIIVNADVTVTASVEIDEATVNSGSTLAVASGITLTVSNGDSDDLTITGILVNNGTVTANSSTLVVYNGGDQTIAALNYSTLSFTGSTSESTKTFADGTTSVDNEIAITNNLTLTGSSSAAVTVQVTEPGITDSRVFYIDANGYTVNITNMHIKGGNTPAANGACIYINDGASSFENITVSHGKATDGSGILIGTNSEGVTMENCVISDNEGLHSYSKGGAILISGGAGTTVLNNCLTKNNSCLSDGVMVLT